MNKKQLQINICIYKCRFIYCKKCVINSFSVITLLIDIIIQKCLKKKQFLHNYVIQRSFYFLLLKKNTDCFIVTPRYDQKYNSFSRRLRLYFFPYNLYWQEPFHSLFRR